MDLKKEIKNNVGIIKICGDTSISAEKKLFDMIKTICAKTKNRLILDLSECTYIDSGAIGSIILINKYISDNGGKFCISGITLEEIEKLFSAAKLYQLITKFNSAEEALLNYF